MPPVPKALSQHLLVNSITDGRKDEPHGKVTMYYHPDGWLRRDKYDETKSTQTPETADSINAVVVFEKADSGRDVSRLVKDPNPLVGLHRRYDDQWGMVSGEPQLWNARGEAWPGFTAFAYNLSYVQDYDAMQFDIDDERPVRVKCVVCNQELERSRIYRFAHHQWDNTFRDHYLRVHAIVPSARLYEVIRDVEGVHLYNCARAQHIQECEEARKEWVWAQILLAIPELKADSKELSSKLRDVYPPAFFFRYYDPDVKHVFDRNFLVEWTKRINDGFRLWARDPQKWKEEINKGIKDPALWRDIQGRVTDVDPKLKAKILDIHKNGFTEIEALLKRHEQRVSRAQAGQK